MSTQDSDVAESYRVSLAFTNVRYSRDGERVRRIVETLFSYFPSLRMLDTERLIQAVYSHDRDTIAEQQRTQFPPQQDLVELPPKNRGSMGMPTPMTLPFGESIYESPFAVRVTPQIGYVSFVLAEVHCHLMLIIEIGTSPFHDQFLGEAMTKLQQEFALKLRTGVYDFPDINLEIQCEVRRKTPVRAAA